MTAVSDAHRSGCLRGLRILIVEDEALIAMAYEDLLADLGCEVVGPAPSVAQALAILATDRPSAALLDVNLDGEISAPVAARLHRSGIPFLVVTGYEELAVGDAVLEAAPRLRKPVVPGVLIQAMQAVFCAGRGSGPPRRGAAADRA